MTFSSTSAASKDGKLKFSLKQRSGRYTQGRTAPGGDSALADSHSASRKPRATLRMDHCEARSWIALHRHIMFVLIAKETWSFICPTGKEISSYWLKPLFNVVKEL